MPHNLNEDVPPYFTDAVLENAAIVPHLSGNKQFF